MDFSRFINVDNLNKLKKQFSAKICQKDNFETSKNNPKLSIFEFINSVFSKKTELKDMGVLVPNEKLEKKHVPIFRTTIWDLIPIFKKLPRFQARLLVRLPSLPKLSAAALSSTSVTRKMLLYARIKVSFVQRILDLNFFLIQR